MPDAIKQRLIAGMNRLLKQGQGLNAAQVGIWSVIVADINALPDSPAATPKAGIRTLGVAPAKRKAKR